MLYSNKDLRKLIIPLIFEQLLTLFVGFADTIMIAAVGEAAVSGVSLVDTVNILIINVFVAFGTGGAVVAGHFLGQKDREQAGKAAWQVNLFSILTGIVVTVVFIIFHDGLMRLIFGRVDQEVMFHAKSYLMITALSIVPLAVYNSCAALFRAMGDSKTTMWISILMNGINVAGNGILIYGAKMGASGAAISTTVSRTVAAVLIFCLMFQSKRVINFRVVFFPVCAEQTVSIGTNISGAGSLIKKIGFFIKAGFRFQPELIRKILYIGIPNSLENSLFQLGKILTLSMVSTYGTYSIAANAVCNTLAGFNMLPALAVNNAILAIVSVCMGAGESGQARMYLKKLMGIANLSLLVMSGAMILASKWLVGFYQLSPEATELAVKVLCYHAAMAVIFWIPSFSLPNAFRAAGDVVWPMAISIFSMWVFRLGLSYFLGTWMGYGLMGIWIAMTVDWVFRAVCFTVRYFGNKWEGRMNGSKVTLSDKNQ